MRDITLDITALPFSKKNAGCMLFYETDGVDLDAENGLYLSQSTEGALMGGAQFLRNKNYMLLTPVRDGQPLTYTYTACASMVRMDTEAGSICFTFTKDGALRAFSEGPDLKITAKMGFGDVAEQQGVSAEVQMDGAEFFMIPAAGKITVDSHYDLLTYRYSDPVIVINTENNKFDVMIYDKSFVDKPYPEVTETFGESVKLMQEEFEDFCAGLVCVPEGLETAAFALYAGYKPFMGKYPGMYFSNVITKCYPVEDEHLVISLAFKDAAAAVLPLCAFTGFATRGGLIPEEVNRRSKLEQTVASEYGLAALQIFERSHPSKEELIAIYDTLETVNEWWTANRSHDGGVSFFYAYPFECGEWIRRISGLTMPCETPDLAAKMVQVAEALAKCAAALGLTAAEEKWTDCASKRLEHLTKDLWTGSAFICRALDGGTCAVPNLISYMPILLGKSLPADISSVLVKDIMDKYFCEGKGILLSPAKSSIDTAVTALIAGALADAGYDAEAKRVTDALIKFCAENGLYLKYDASDAPKKRCGSLYQPAASAAVLYAASKAL